MLDKDVLEKPSRVAVSALKRRKGENVEPNELKQLAVPSANVAPILSQKQHNILSMQNQKQNFVAGLNRNGFSIYDEAVDSRERQDKPFLDRHQVSEIDMNMDSKVSLPARECIQQGNDHITDETAMKLVGDEQPTSIMKEHQQAASAVFSSKELKLARQKLEKIAYTAKALQLGLKDHPSREEMPITKTTIDRNEARDWLPKTAFERVTNKLPDISCDSGRVRQLVQTFERMK